MGLKVKINIAGRMYPLTIREEDELAMRNAAKQIDELLKNFEKNYAVSDKQDVLAMCALHLASKIESQKIEQDNLINKLQAKIKQLNQQVESTLLP